MATHLSKLLTARTLALFLLLELMGASANAFSIVPPKRIFGSNEVLWFSITGPDLVVCWADGTVGVWNPAMGKLVSHFKLAPDHFDPETCAHSLRLSRQVPPTLAVLAPGERWENDKLFRDLVIYGIESGTPTGTNSIEAYSCHPLGFVERSSILLCVDSPPANAIVYAVDVTTGKTVNRVETEDDVQTGTIVGLEGKILVNFCRGNRLIARDMNGRQLWERTIAKGRMAEPAHWPNSLSLPYVVVAEYDVSDGSGHVDFIAVALRDGTELWRRRNQKFGCLKAISRDGRTQALSIGGCLELLSLPDLPAKRLSRALPDCDAIFSDDQRTILCLPVLAIVSKTKDGRVVTMARRTHGLRVFETKTGKLVKEIALRHPAAKH